MTDAAPAFHAAVLAALRHAPDVIEPGRLHRFSTNGRRGDSAGWCKLFDDLRGGVFGCYRLGISETWTASNRAGLTREQRAALARQVMCATMERTTQMRRLWEHNRARNAQMWAACVPLTADDAVACYLRRRGVSSARPLPSVLRLHPALPYWQGQEKLGTYPAMVAPVVAADGRILALHRTYLTNDGRKADVPSPKKLTRAAGPLAGACIPLHQAAGGVLGIAEGIETALAAACGSGVPTVASYCAGNLSAWQWPAGVRRLVIFGDNDRAGMQAAEALQVRALHAGLQTNVMVPADAGADWLDVWAQRGAVALEAGV